MIKLLLFLIKFLIILKFKSFLVIEISSLMVNDCNNEGDQSVEDGFPRKLQIEKDLFEKKEANFLGQYNREMLKSTPKILKLGRKTEHKRSMETENF